MGVGRENDLIEQVETVLPGRERAYETEVGKVQPGALLIWRRLMDHDPAQVSTVRERTQGRGVG